MRTGDYCAYPPLLAPSVSVTQQRQGGSIRYIVGDDAVGRFLLLGSNEHDVLRLINGSRDLQEIREEFNRRSTAPLSLNTPVGFLRTLDDANLFAGMRAERKVRRDDTTPHLYIRFPRFNPESLLTRLAGSLRWDRRVERPWARHVE